MQEFWLLFAKNLWAVVSMSVIISLGFKFLILRE